MLKSKYFKKIIFQEHTDIKMFKNLFQILSGVLGAPKINLDNTLQSKCKYSMFLIIEILFIKDKNGWLFSLAGARKICLENIFVLTNIMHVDKSWKLNNTVDERRTKLTFPTIIYDTILVCHYLPYTRKWIDQDYEENLWE